MKNRDVIAILESLSPDAELVIEVGSIEDTSNTILSYDFGCSVNEFGELVLKALV